MAHACPAKSRCQNTCNTAELLSHFALNNIGRDSVADRPDLLKVQNGKFVIQSCRGHFGNLQASWLLHYNRNSAQLAMDALSTFMFSSQAIKLLSNGMLTWNVSCLTLVLMEVTETNAQSSWTPDVFSELEQYCLGDHQHASGTPYQHSKLCFPTASKARISHNSLRSHSSH